MAKTLFSILIYYFLFFSLSILANNALGSFSNSNVLAAPFFGDLILDAESNHYNKNCSIQARFPFYGQDFLDRPTGRFTNGRTVPDFIAEYLGLDLQMPYLRVDLLVMSGKVKSNPANKINCVQVQKWS